MKDQERARRHAQRRDQEMRQQIREILLEAQPKMVAVESLKWYKTHLVWLH